MRLVPDRRKPSCRDEGHASECPGQYNANEAGVAALQVVGRPHRSAAPTSILDAICAACRRSGRPQFRPSFVKLAPSDPRGPRCGRGSTASSLHRPAEPGRGQRARMFSFTAAACGLRGEGTA